MATDKHGGGDHILSIHRFNQQLSESLNSDDKHVSAAVGGKLKVAGLNPSECDTVAFDLCCCF